MGDRIKILLVEHNPDDIELIQNELNIARLDFVSEIVQSRLSYIHAITNFIPDIILSDYSLPSFDGPQALQIREEIAADTPFIFVSGSIGEERSIEYIRNGVTDYVLKDKLFTLSVKVERALKEAKENRKKNKIERELIQSEGLLARAQKIAHLGSWELNFADNVLKLSVEGRRIFGLLPDQNSLSFDTWSSLVHPDDISQVLETIEESQRTMADTNYQHRIILKDGSIRHIYSESKFEIDVNGKPVGIYGIMQDITDKLKSEEKIKEGELRYRSVVEQTTDAIYVIDASEKIIEMNASGCQMFGYSHEEVLNLSLSDLFFKTDLIHKPLQHANLKPGHAMLIECRVKRKDGTALEMELSGRVIEKERILIFGHDITNRKKAENSVKESEAKFRAFFENSLDGILLTEPNGKILAANPAACKMFRMDESELCNTESNALVALRETGIVSLIQEVKLTGKVKAEITYVRNDASKFAAEINSVLFIDSYGRQRTSVIIRDISERKIAEEKILRTSHELERVLHGLTNIMDSSLDIICTIDEEGKFVTVSLAALSILGYQPEYLVGKRFIDLVVDQDIERTIDSTAGVLNGMPVTMFENSNKRKNGTIVPLLWSAKWNDHDKLMYCIARDATEKTKLENAFDSERRRLNNLFSEAPTSMGVLRGPDHIFEIANPLYLELIGKHDIIGKTVKEVLPEVVEQGFIAILDHVYSTGETFSANEMHIKLNQSDKVELDRYLNFIYQAYRDIDNIIEGILFFVFDVTEQVIARKRIEESERSYRTLFEQNLVGIYQITDEGKIINCNSAFAKMLKYDSPDDLKEINPIELYFTNEERTSFIEKLKDKKQLYNYEGVLKCKDGTPVYLLQNISEQKDPKTGLSLFDGVMVDISQKKSAELKLTVSNERFINVSKATSDAIWDWNLIDQTIYWGEGFQNVFGYNPKELKNDISSWHQHIHPEDIKRVTAKIYKFIEGNQTSWSDEYRYLKMDQTYAYVIDKGFVIRDQKSKAVRMVGAMQDITKKKEMEELLDKANNLARIGGWEFNLLKGMLYWTDITKEIHEVEPNFIPDLNTAINFYKEGYNRDLITQKVKNAVENGVAYDIELQIITAKGNEKWIRCLGETEFINGKCVRQYGSFQDIDKRKTAEISAKKILEEKNIILESIGDAFFAVDKNWMVTYWNKQAEKMLVKPKAEIVGHNFWEVFPDWINSDAYEKFHAAIDLNTVIDLDINYASLDKWYEAIAYPSETGLSIYFKDVTERKLSQLRLGELNSSLQLQTKELAISNLELEQFAYVASHDLQEPLRMITSFLTLLENKYENLIDDSGKKYIYFAVDGANRMRQIILDLLEFSRVGKANDSIQDLNLNELINEIQILLQNEIQDKKALIEVGELPIIKGYHVPVRQVFQNLISNALKYSKKDTICEIKITAKKIDTYWQFAITDNGIGIPEEYFHKIFVVFQRLHNKPEFSGTGIGLAITKKIIESVGGKIWVESEEGKGSTFYFLLSK